MDADLDLDGNDVMNVGTGDFQEIVYRGQNLGVLLGLQADIEAILEGYATLVQLQEAIDQLVGNGLRARLTTGNLLTGSLIVEMVNRTELSGASIDTGTRPYASLPVLASNVDAVTADIETLIKNLSALPLDSLVAAATQLLQDTRTLIASPELATLPGQLSSSLASIASVASQVESATADLPAMVQSLTAASRNANDVLEGLSPDSEIYFELSATVRELRAAAKSIATFAELLERNPNAILTGR
jgi:paraquat-inducible protein B